MKKLLLLFCIIPFYYIGHSQTWTKLTSGTATNLIGIHAPSASVAYACGFFGIVLKTTDGGTTWVQKPTGTPEMLYDIYFTDVNTGYVIGDNGSSLKTTDGGTTWSPMFISNQNFRSIWFENKDIGYTVTSSGVSGGVFKTTDAGATWNQIGIPSATGLYSVQFNPSTIGYVGDYSGTIFKTIDGGASWTSKNITSTPLNGTMVFLDANRGLVTGLNGRIFRTIDAGNNWSSAASGTTDALTGLDFSDSNHGFAVGGDVAANTYRMVSTSDGGASWTNVSLEPGTKRLCKVNFFSSTVGYTVGFEGYIYKWSAPVNVILDARFTSSQPGCLGQLENFYSVVSGTPGLTHSWSFGKGATPSTSTSEDPAGIVYSSSGAKLVTHIVSNGTTADTVTNIITINPSPIASFSVKAATCINEIFNVTNTSGSSPGVTYAWDFGTGAIPQLSTGANPQGIYYQSSGTKTITLTVTNQFGCVTSSTQNIVVNSLPIAFAGLDTTICPHTSVQLGKLPDSGISYTWFPSSTLSNKNSSNPVASPIAPVTTYFLTATSLTTGCKNQDSITVTMLDYLKANAGVDGEVCRYNNFQLGIGLVKGQTYSWNPVKGLNDPSLPNPVAKPDSTTTYTVTVTANGCTAVTDNVTLTVHQLPHADAGVNDTISRGASILLNAKGGIQYNWLPETGLSNAGIYNPLASPRQTTSYTVTVTDIYGCVNKDSMLLTVLTSHFWVPTAFTPDGNGTSDIFYVRGEDIRNFECMVFNRFGEQIFSSKNIEVGWDGKRQNGGEELPEGAYVYHIKGILSTGEIVNATGLINLIR